MKKIISLVLAAALLLGMGAYACAEEEPAVSSHSHTLSDICIVYNDQIIDLSDMRIELDVSADGQANAGRLHVDVNGQSAAELGLTMVDGMLVLHLESQSLGHVDYAIDPVAVLARTMQNVIDGLIGLLQQIDIDGTAQSIVDSILGMANGEGQEPQIAPAEPSPEPETSVSIPDISIDGDVMDVILGCISEPETVHMGGTEFGANGSVTEMPDGEYQVQSFSFDTDTICKILEMIQVNGQSLDVSDSIRQAGVDVSLDGVFYDGELAHIGQISCAYAYEDQSVNVGFGYNRRLTEAGAATSYSFGMSQGADLESLTGMSISFTLSDGEADGEQLTPDSVNLDEAVVLSDMDTEQAMEELSQAMQTLTTDMLGALAQVLVANMDMDALAGQ